MFERYGPAAERSGCAMLTAFGYDWVPGNLAGALALRHAGDDAVRVDVGYFFTGKAAHERRHAGVRGRRAGATPLSRSATAACKSERGAKRVRSFSVGGKETDAVSVGSSEHFTLPRVAPQLREVNAYLGWFGPLARPMQVLSLGLSLPGVRVAEKAVGERFVKGSTGGPDAEARERVRLAHRGDRLRRGGARALEVHVTGRRRLHVHRPHARLGGRAGRRGRAPGHGRAGPGGRLRARSRSPTAAAGRAWSRDHPAVE